MRAERFPAVLLRLEGLAVAVASIVAYAEADFGWLLFAVLALAPDISFAGYAAGPRIGALVYDVAHTEALPLALAVVGVLADADLGVQLALIWLMHIGVDRVLGYGLKYPTAFGDTHLQRV